MLKDFLLSSLSKAVNTFLKLDPDSRKRVSRLQDKVISIELLPLHFTFLCTFTADRIHIIASSPTDTPDAKLRGTPLQMLGAVLTKENRHRFFADDLVIEGNAEIAQQVINLFDHLHIDWEDHLSRLTGDVPAWHAGRMVSKVTDWLRKTDDRMCENISDYIHEEGQWLPTREALQDLFTDIDTIRMDTDRLEARFNQLADEINHEERQ